MYLIHLPYICRDPRFYFLDRHLDLYNRKSRPRLYYQNSPWNATNFLRPLSSPLAYHSSHPLVNRVLFPLQQSLVWSSDYIYHRDVSEASYGELLTRACYRFRWTQARKVWDGANYIYALRSNNVKASSVGRPFLVAKNEVGLH